ncbi:ATP-binding protein [Patescibacteria group bacterium]|nr:ATP-binding protein [Patescibacteria group bacterium]
MKLANVLKIKKNNLFPVFILLIIVPFLFNISYDLFTNKSNLVLEETLVYYILILLILAGIYKYTSKIKEIYTNNIFTPIIILSYIYFFYSTRGLYPSGHINNIIYLIYYTIIIIVLINSEKYIVYISSILLLISTYLLGNHTLQIFFILLIESAYVYIVVEMSYLLSEMIQKYYEQYLYKNNIRENIEHTRSDSISYIKMLIRYIDNIISSLKKENTYTIEKTNLKNFKRKLKDRIIILQNKEKNATKLFIFNNLIPKIISELYPITKERHISIEYIPYITSSISIQNNSRKIKSILFYIIENAVMFAEENTSITVTTEEKNNNLQISIQNYSKTFNYTNDIYSLSYSTGVNKGEGFGLFCAKKFANILGITINIYKDYANLTTAIIKIPI